MPTELCFEIYNTKLGPYNFTLDNKDHILQFSMVYQNDIEIQNFQNQNEKKFDIFILTRFYNKSALYINNLLTSYKSCEKLEELVTNFSDQLQVANKEFKLSKIVIEEIFKRTFNVINGYVKLDEFFSFFAKKYSFKININEFIEISLSNAIRIYHFMETKMSKLFYQYDSRKQGMMVLRDFEHMMLKILSENENKWKIQDYFGYLIKYLKFYSRMCMINKDKDFCTLQEFLFLIFNQRELLKIVVSQLSSNKEKDDLNY